MKSLTKEGRALLGCVALPVLVLITVICWMGCMWWYGSSYQNGHSYFSPIVATGLLLIGVNAAFCFVCVGLVRFYRSKKVNLSWGLLAGEFIMFFPLAFWVDPGAKFVASGLGAKSIVSPPLHIIAISFMLLFYLLAPFGLAELLDY